MDLGSSEYGPVQMGYENPDQGFAPSGARLKLEPRSNVKVMFATVGSGVKRAQRAFLISSQAREAGFFY